MLMQTKRLAALLVLVIWIFWAGWARAQVAPGEEKAQRQAEIDQLRAQQAQLRAQLEVLAVEKQRLQRELGQRKAGAEAAQDAAREQQQQRNADRMVARERAEQNEPRGRAQLDLVSLANNYVDAMGSVKLAEVRMQAMEEKQDQIGIRIEKVNLDTAKRKVMIFRGIIEAAREAARADLDLAEQQVKGGLAPVNSVNEAKARVRILEVILAQ